jgi:hypothetical protein
MTSGKSYDYLHIRRMVEQMPEFRWCANDTCHCGWLHSGGKGRLEVLFPCNDTVS